MSLVTMFSAKMSSIMAHITIWSFCTLIRKLGHFDDILLLIQFFGHKFMKLAFNDEYQNVFLEFDNGPYCRVLRSYCPL